MQLSISERGLLSLNGKLFPARLIVEYLDCLHPQVVDFFQENELSFQYFDNIADEEYAIMADYLGLAQGAHIEDLLLSDYSRSSSYCGHLVAPNNTCEQCGALTALAH